MYVPFMPLLTVVAACHIFTSSVITPCVESEVLGF